MYTIENKDGSIYTFLHMVKSAGTSIHTSLIEANKITHVNQRHASINNLPEKYQEYPRIIAVRSPEDWYKSFYRFFLGVEGYMSFMLNDPSDPFDGYIYPIGLDEFVRRSINLKDTLIKYPNKARVFRNLLRSQGNMHFITGYFENDFSPERPETMDQFDMSLYEWFFNNVGGRTARCIPMDRLDIIEELFDVKIPHVNKTSENKPNNDFRPETLELIKSTHKEFYDEIDTFDEKEIKEWLN